MREKKTRKKWKKKRLRDTSRKSKPRQKVY